MTDAVDAWVRRVNQAARTLDETAAAIHPSAWPEALHDDMERFKRLAAAGPRPNDECPEVRHD
ncbi:MAG: hypothetical protein ACYC5Y_05055 [Symbiobacteriia bacterium]